MNDYVVATFVVVWFVLLLYVGAVAMRTSRMAREVELLTRLVQRTGTGEPGPTPSDD